jgi:hypothetical protein
MPNQRTMAHGPEFPRGARGLPIHGLRVRRAPLALAAALGLALGAPALGQESATESAPKAAPAAAEPAAPAATVEGAATGSDAAPPGLDSLLKLPKSDSYDDVDMRGGRSPGEWRARFTELRDRLAKERARLAEARAELDETASKSDAWKMATPIPGVEVQDSESPIDFQLRQRIRRHRAEIDRLERHQRELEIEASLAGVPDDWRS